MLRDLFKFEEVRIHFDQSVSQMQEQYDLLQMRLEDWSKTKKPNEILLLAVVNIGGAEYPGTMPKWELD